MMMAALIGQFLDADALVWYIVIYIGIFINVYDALISVMK